MVSCRPYSSSLLLSYRLRNSIGHLFLALSGLCLIALVLSQPAAFGQSQFATLSGTVNDPNGGVVAGAKVAVKGTSSGELRQTETNGDGFFTLATLPAGSYEVTVQVEGFQMWRGKDIVLNGSDNRSMKIMLKVGVITDSVVVEGSTTERVHDPRVQGGV